MAPFYKSTCFPIRTRDVGCKGQKPLAEYKTKGSVILNRSDLILALKSDKINLKDPAKIW